MFQPLNIQSLIWHYFSFFYEFFYEYYLLWPLSHNGRLVIVLQVLCNWTKRRGWEGSRESEEHYQEHHKYHEQYCSAFSLNYYISTILFYPTQNDGWLTKVQFRKDCPQSPSLYENENLFVGWNNMIMISPQLDYTPQYGLL